ncbi:septum site-determining protein MinC [Crenobacter caeni]|uniref:Probable septum site-determining protein MinC n=1 Tax=Crenobacter caeni TaxID=2705474 RepID=A0A6B2KPS7_9NEIS|nr:septum site-determining protein MinC [Crenobacter caeni]NDV12143.1 septum site-determining protein MinC [Crenobacter caeni]
MNPAASPFEIKSASLDLLALMLHNSDLDAFERALGERFGNRFADGDEAFVLDLNGLPDPAALDLDALLAKSRARGVRVVALRHDNGAYGELARAHGLGFAGAGSATTRAAVQAPPAELAAPALPAAPSVGMVIDKPVRAGQQIYARGTDLVVLAMVSAGAEVIADGNIHVYAPLRGRALAGARGNQDARIFVQAMEAELVSIAGVYRTIEQSLPAAIQGQRAQVYLENDKLVIAALGG